MFGKIKEKIQQLLANDWVIALLLTLFFLAIKGYRYAWDDQHLEIPLLKALIDPNLFLGDYYVTSLKTHFISYFYVLLSRVINVGQVEGAYLVLYLVSRYFLIFWMYKFWALVTKNRFMSFVCVYMLLSLSEIPEFLYNTFSHQEFTLAIVFAGIYFFYREKFILASAILGVATNFHALYSLYPMTFVSLYLLLEIKKRGWKLFIKSGLAYLVCALPILIWIMKKRFLPGAETVAPGAGANDWIALYKIACLQTFMFEGISFKYLFTHPWVWLFHAKRYVFLLALYFLNLSHNETFRKDKKIHAIALTSLLAWVFSYIFTFYFPTRFVLDLNLVRYAQYLAFFLVGYTVFLILQLLDKQKTWIAYLSIILFGFFFYGQISSTIPMVFLMIFLFCIKFKETPQGPKIFLQIFLYVLLGAALGLIGLSVYKFQPMGRMILLYGVVILTCIYFLIQRFSWIRAHMAKPNRLFMIAFLIAILASGVNNHLKRNLKEETGSGFWKMQRDWKGMQSYVRENTPTNAVFMTPYDTEMGGFRIAAERTVICCYRDCGIIGFDLNATWEWLRRIRSIEPFKVILDSVADIRQPMAIGIYKYKVNYIVFMRYYAPKTDESPAFRKIYENDSFSLYEIKINPVLNGS